MTEETRLEYVDEFSEPAGVPGVAHMVADLGVGVAFCIVDGLEFWLRARESNGRVVLAGPPIVPTAEEHAAFFRLHPETRPLQQPARGVRATSSGVLRLVK